MTRILCVSHIILVRHQTAANCVCSSPSASLRIAYCSGYTHNMPVGEVVYRARRTACKAREIRTNRAFMAASMKMAVFWVTAPCSLVQIHERFRGACCLHHQGDNRHLHMKFAWTCHLSDLQYYYLGVPRVVIHTRVYVRNHKVTKKNSDDKEKWTFSPTDTCLHRMVTPEPKPARHRTMPALNTVLFMTTSEYSNHFVKHVNTLHPRWYVRLYQGTYYWCGGLRASRASPEPCLGGLGETSDEDRYPGPPSMGAVQWACAAVT
jgi:hypothetical protein